MELLQKARDLLQEERKLDLADHLKRMEACNTKLTELRSQESGASCEMNVAPKEALTLPTEEVIKTTCDKIVESHPQSAEMIKQLGPLLNNFLQTAAQIQANQQNQSSPTPAPAEENPQPPEEVKEMPQQHNSLTEGGPQTGASQASTSEQVAPKPAPATEQNSEEENPGKEEQERANQAAEEAKRKVAVLQQKAATAKEAFEHATKHLEEHEASFGPLRTVPSARSTPYA